MTWVTRIDRFCEKCCKPLTCSFQDCGFEVTLMPVSSVRSGCCDAATTAVVRAFRNLDEAHDAGFGTLKRKEEAA